MPLKTANTPRRQHLSRDAVHENVPGIEAAVRIRNRFDPQIVQSAGRNLPLQGYYADENFLRVFTFPLLEGNAGTALIRPFTAVITRSTSEKLFRHESAIGKCSRVDGLGGLEITGVLEDYERSHFFFEIIASYSTLALLEQQKKIAPSLENWGPVNTW